MPAKDGSWDVMFRTGGEWEYSPNAVIYDGKGFGAVVPIPSPHFGVPEEETQKVLGNISKIVVAPDLYAALKDAVAEAEFAIANDLAPKSIFLSWLKNAKEALEKAEKEYKW